MPPVRPFHLVLFRAPIALVIGPRPAPAASPGDDPFADAVVAYVAGTGAAAGYDQPATALARPERLTGELFAFPGVVSVFNPPFGPDEIVSIGAGGALVLRFDTPVTDDADNLYGIDLLLFGNTGFIDLDYPNGLTGAGLFGADPFTVEVSADGATWHAVTPPAAPGHFPTVGYEDAGPYDEAPGAVPTDFTRPVDPALGPADLAGLSSAQVLALYRGAGGGVGIDLAPTGLGQITHVRISNPTGSTASVEVDAVADVAPRLPGDVNLDGFVDVADLLLVLAEWGPVTPGAPPADLDGSNTVNVTDLLLVLAGWSS